MSDYLLTCVCVCVEAYALEAFSDNMKVDWSYKYIHMEDFIILFDEGAMNYKCLSVKRRWKLWMNSVFGQELFSFSS